MVRHTDISAGELRSQIRKRVLLFGGNEKLKIYGTLACKSGKRLKKENRLFFRSREEATAQGFRPCGHCLRSDYQHWKKKVAIGF